MLLILLCAAALTLMIFERSLLFHPMRGHDALPASAGLEHEELSIDTSDGVRLHGWFFPRKDARATLLFFHGNAGNISHRLPKARILHGLGLSVAMVDYRGYGASKGSPSEAGTYRDATASYAALAARKDVDPTRIVCYGESLGGGVALELATRKSCLALVIESSFTSIPALVGDLFPYLPLRHLVATKYESLARLPRIHAPILFLHGTNDDLIPFAHGERNFAAANEPKELFAVKGAGHNDVHVVAGADYGRRIDAFLSRAIPGFL